MNKLSTNPRYPLEKLRTYPAFQNLRAKAETHQLQFRPKETARLRKAGTLDKVLDERTQSAWNALQDCRNNGMHLNEAEELAYPMMLLPSEREEKQRDSEESEQTENQ